MQIKKQEKDLKKIKDGKPVTKIPVEIQKKIYRKLMMIAAAKKPEYLMNPPGNKLEKLSGDRKDQWSIRVNKKWRICFEWGNDEAVEVTLEQDYH